MPTIKSLLAPQPEQQKRLVPEPVPDPSEKPFRFVCCGASGSGKTTVLMNCLLFFWKDKRNLSLFDEIFIFASSALNDPIWKVLLQDEDVKKKVELRDTLDEDLLHDLISSENKDHVRRLIWIDDFAGSKKNLGTEIINDCFFRSRHSGTSVLLTTQYYYMVPVQIRTNCSHLALFKVTQQMTLPMILNELSTVEVNQEALKEMINEATKESHGFLFIDMLASPRKFYSSFLEELSVASSSSLPPTDEPSNNTVRDL